MDFKATTLGRSSRKEDIGADDTGSWFVMRKIMQFKSSPNTWLFFLCMNGWGSFPCAALWLYLGFISFWFSKNLFVRKYNCLWPDRFVFSQNPYIFLHTRSGQELCMSCVSEKHMRVPICGSVHVRGDRCIVVRLSVQFLCLIACLFKRNQMFLGVWACVYVCACVRVHLGTTTVYVHIYIVACACACVRVPLCFAPQSWGVFSAFIRTAIQLLVQLRYHAFTSRRIHFVSVKLLNQSYKSRCY